MDKTPISLILPNIRSAMNIGAIFRTADAMGAEKIYLTGYSATPEHPKVGKTAIGAEETVAWEYVEDTMALIQKLRSDGYEIVSLEKNDNSQTIYDYTPSFPLALVVGNEIEGVDKSILEISDKTVHLPMLGTKESLNVATATGITLYYLLEKYSAKRK